MGNAQNSSALSLQLPGIPAPPLFLTDKPLTLTTRPIAVMTRQTLGRLCARSLLRGRPIGVPGLLGGGLVNRRGHVRSCCRKYFFYASLSSSGVLYALLPIRCRDCTRQDQIEHCKVFESEPSTYLTQLGLWYTQQSLLRSFYYWC